MDTDVESAEEKEAREYLAESMRKHIAALQYLAAACDAHQRLKDGLPAAPAAQIN